MNEVIGMRWRSCDDLPEQLNILHFRLIDNSTPIPYRTVTISESFGNKWLRFWNCQWDIKNYTFPEVQWLDESGAEEINAHFDKLIGENYSLSQEVDRLKKENADTIEQLKKFSENNFQ